MQIISGAGVNGAILHCLELTRELARRGHDVTVVCRPDSWIAQQLRDAPVQVVESDLHRIPADELKRIAALCRREAIEIVHTHMSRAHFFGVLLRWWFAGLPTVATAHNTKIQLHWAFNDHVIACSEAARRFHRAFNLVRRIETIHCFVDVERFANPEAGARQALREAWGFGPETPLAGILANVIPKKGHHHLLKAWQHVARDCPEARLAIVGNCEHDREYTERLKADAERLGIVNEVLWVGYRKDIPEVLAALDVVVCAATEEALGLTAAEAAAARRPVVAAATGGLRETVVDQVTGLLVPAGNATAMSQAITRLLEDPRQRQQFGEAGYDRVGEMFSREAYLGKLEALYERLTSKRQRRAA